MAEELRANDLSLAEVFKTNSITGFRFKQFNYKYLYATKKTILSQNPISRIRQKLLVPAPTNNNIKVNFFLKIFKLVCSTQLVYKRIITSLSSFYLMFHQLAQNKELVAISQYLKNILLYT